MGQFSQEMRQLAKDLCRELGNKSVLTKVTAGDYDPATGKTTQVKKDTIVYTAQNNRISAFLPMDGQNTNLQGFSESGQLVPWFGEEIDTTWLFDGNNISGVGDIKSQNEVIAYIISVGEKP